MKKLLYLLSATLLVFTSCNNDEDNSYESSFILPKTIKYTDLDYPSENFNSTVTYNGNKIVSIKGEHSRTNYTYDGNLIVKSVDYDIEDGKEEKDSEVTYDYKNGKLVTTTFVENFTAEYPTGQYKGKYAYTYNADGTVKRESFDINPKTGIETKNNYISVFTFMNGNLVKEVATDETSGSNYVHTDVYEYDAKNNPLKNILGYNLLLDEYSVNNVIKHTVSSAYVSGSDVYKTEYIYEANGYPTKKTNYKEDGTTVNGIDEYTY